MADLIVAVTGATGSAAAEILIAKSPWPVALLATRWGRTVFERERGSFDALASRAAHVYDVNDLSAEIASGSTRTAGMVILPCTSNTLAGIAAGTGSNLITRAAHCHLKERRRLILCLRETPLSLIDIRNMATVTEAGGIVMPLSPPYYMNEEKDPAKVNLAMLFDAYVDRVLGLLGAEPGRGWKDVK